MMNLILLLFAGFIELSKCDGGCKVLDFLECLKNKTFTGHVIESFRVLAPGLEMCQHKCFLEDKCVSYNLGPALGVIRSCELNDADHVSDPGHVVSKKDFEYCPIKNPCSSNPCSPNWRCTPDFLWDTFKCSGCSEPLGMQDGNITDSQITASSTHGTCKTSYGRLHKTPTSSSSYDGGWCSLQAQIGDYLQIDLGSIKWMTKIATQGRGIHTNHHQWVTEYTLSFSNNTSTWQAGGLFAGNEDKYTVVTQELTVPIETRYVRILPKKWSGWMSMRVELYGC